MTALRTARIARIDGSASQAGLWFGMGVGLVGRWSERVAPHRRRRTG